WADFCIMFMDIDGPMSDWHGDIDLAREYWEAYGEELTAEHAEEHPGTRPAPWWYFTHGESRPIVNPLPAEEESRLRREHTFNGVLHTSIRHGRRGNEDVRMHHDDGIGGMVPWQEHETDYLDRLDMLTDEERQTLGR